MLTGMKVNNNYYDAPLFPYEWNLEDAVFKKDKGKVFSFFSGGGGSTMGYELAGFDVIGCNEIDPRQMELYVANHHPVHAYLEPIQEFIKRGDLAAELYDLDILDGSFPCTTFSMCGKREEVWGVERKYAEGNYNQVLDTLAFEFIKAIDKFRPKVIIGENVTGLLMGDAVHYIRRVHHELARIGYLSNHHVVRGEELGLPQKRHRVFITGIREDLAVSSGLCVKSRFIRQVPPIDLTFNCKPVTYGEIEREDTGDTSCLINDGIQTHKWWGLAIIKGKQMCDVHPAGYFSNPHICYPSEPVSTIMASSYMSGNLNYRVCRGLNRVELCLASSWPLDYDFKYQKHSHVLGMSVPPIMMANVATRVHEQWLSRLK
jgi:DNA (cytosine-5)-methyltransferase 1